MVDVGGMLFFVVIMDSYVMWVLQNSMSSMSSVMIMVYIVCCCFVVLWFVFGLVFWLGDCGCVMM